MNLEKKLIIKKLRLSLIGLCSASLLVMAGCGAENAGKSDQEKLNKQEDIKNKLKTTPPSCDLESTEDEFPIDQTETITAFQYYGFYNESTCPNTVLNPNVTENRYSLILVDQLSKDRQCIGLAFEEQVTHLDRVKDAASFEYRLTNRSNQESKKSKVDCSYTKNSFECNSSNSISPTDINYDYSEIENCKMELGYKLNIDTSMGYTTLQDGTRLRVYKRVSTETGAANCEIKGRIENITKTEVEIVSAQTHSALQDHNDCRPGLIMKATRYVDDQNKVISYQSERLHSYQ